jgi:hypothetical protein
VAASDRKAGVVGSMGFMVMAREAAVYDYFVGTNAGVRNILEGRDSKFSSDRGALGSM